MSQLIYSERDFQNERFFLASSEKGLAFLSAGETAQAELTKIHQKHFADYELVRNDEILQEYWEEIVEYLAGNRQLFSMPLHIKGTEFQQSIWRALQEIPYGETKSYTEVAEIINRPKAFRAVANAVGQNPILIVIPCHRIVHKDGNISGFRLGVQMKKQLLTIEGKKF